MGLGGGGAGLGGPLTGSGGVGGGQGLGAGGALADALGLGTGGALGGNVGGGAGSLGGAGTGGAAAALAGGASGLAKIGGGTTGAGIVVFILRGAPLPYSKQICRKYYPRHVSIVFGSLFAGFTQATKN